MYFKTPYKVVSKIPTALLSAAEKNAELFEKSDAYNFKYGQWLRLDSYHNPENYQIKDITGTEIVDYVTSLFPDDEFFGWSVSHLPAKADIVDHADRMLFHRFAKRIIVCLSDVNDVLNWHWSKDGTTKRPYFFEYGTIYQLNTASTHGVKNYSNKDRRAVYFDMMPSRLYEKMKSHPDILTVILSNATGEKYVL